MANSFHSVKANIHENPLTENLNDFIAKVISERTLGIADVCASAVARGGADTTAQTMEHNVNMFFKEMAYRLCDGFSINTGYFMAHAQIKGAFHSPTEKFDPEKHQLLIQFIQGELMRRMLPEVVVEIIGMADNGHSVAQVTDVKSGSVNELLTPSRNLKIKGNKIRLVGTVPDIGLYFINQSTDERTKVPTDDIVVNNPSELIVVTPELVAGTYQIELVTQFTSSGLLKEPRTTVFEKVLTVQ